MRVRFGIFIVVIVLLGAATLPAPAQEEMAATRTGVTVDLAAWADSPAGFLLTKKELKEWKNLTGDAERRAFIDLFWARRNPDPSQSFNQFKAQFESRVRYADENFGYKSTRGALSDRGRILILMGPPQQAEHRGPTETVQGMGGIGEPTQNRATDEVRASAEMWVYDPARLPEALSVKGSRLLFVFYEERAETNEYVLDRSHPEAVMGMKALTKAPDVYLLHPDLQQVPKPVSVPGGRPAEAAHLAWLDRSAPWTERARAVAELGMADASRRPVWLHLELPPDAPTLDLLAGRVRSADGEVLSTFEVDAAALARGDRAAYHLTFPIAEGSYALEVVGAAAGSPQVAYSADVTVPAVPAEGTWMSPVWVGVETEVEDDAMLGSAFCFGRLHLVPLLSGSEVRRQSELTFLGFAVRPSLDEGGSPKLEARIALSQGGRRLGRPLVMPLDGVRLAEDLYVFMNAINLAALPETGEYDLVFSVTDSISEVSTEREIGINVVD